MDPLLTRRLQLAALQATTAVGQPGGGGGDGKVVCARGRPLGAKALLAAVLAGARGAEWAGWVGLGRVRALLRRSKAEAHDLYIAKLLRRAKDPHDVSPP